MINLKIDIGGGYRRKHGFIAIDIDPSVRPDIKADAHYLPLRNASVTEVNLSHVLEHLQNPVSALLEIKRVLSKRGSAIITVPDIRFPWTLYILYKYGSRVNPFERHHWNVSYVFLNVFLTSLGFEVSERQYIPPPQEERHWGVEFLFWATPFDYSLIPIRWAKRKLPFLRKVIDVINSVAYRKPNSSPEIRITATLMAP